MMPHTLEDIYAAKQARRARLAKLPIDQRVEIIEQLHRLGRTMIEARESLPKPAPGPESR
jgi:hypothetical protein